MSATDKVGLFDGDIFAYKTAAAFQINTDWGDGVVSKSTGDIADAEVLVSDRIEAIANKLKLTRIIMCLSDSTNFRYRVLPTYKENRKDTERPLLLPDMVQYLKDNYEYYLKPDLEADDVMGILSTHKKLIPGKRVIISIDKDMQCIPGWLYNNDKFSKPKRVTEVEADRYHMTQTLIGDSTDGYKGCPGIGPKKASDLLEGMTDSREMWEAVAGKFKEAGLTEADALVQARVARICRASDYDFKRKKVKLWRPKQ